MDNPLITLLNRTRDLSDFEIRPYADGKMVVVALKDGKDDRNTAITHLGRQLHRDGFSILFRDQDGEAVTSDGSHHDILVSVVWAETKLGWSYDVPGSPNTPNIIASGPLIRTNTTVPYRAVLCCGIGGFAYSVYTQSIPDGTHRPWLGGERQDSRFWHQTQRREALTKFYKRIMELEQ